MFCTQCGSLLEGDSVFCSKCGHRVEGKADAVENTTGSSASPEDESGRVLRGEFSGTEQTDSASCVLGGVRKGLFRSGRWIPETHVVRENKKISISTIKFMRSTDYNLEQSDIVGISTRTFMDGFRIFVVIFCILLAASVLIGAPLYFGLVGVLCAVYHSWVGQCVVIVINTNYSRIEIPVRYEEEIYRLKEVLGR